MGMKARTLGLLMYLVVFHCSCVWAAGIEISRFTERILMLENGSARVEVTLLLPTDSLHEILLPCGFDNAVGISSVDNAGYSASLVSLQGVQYIRLESTASLPKECRAMYTVPGFFDLNKKKSAAFGNYTLNYRFINSTSTPIRHYEGEIDLLPGYVVTSIEESTPPLTEKDPVAPYWVSTRESRRTITLQADRLRLGDHASISFRLKPETKSPILLGGLSLAALLYLIFFRDVLKDPNGMSQTGSAS